MRRSTSPASLEWKKRLDRWTGLPLSLVLALARAASPRRPLARPEDVRHVVLAKLWGIGNLAMLLPYVAAVRRRFPRARVTFLTLARNRPLLEGQPGIDALLTLRDAGLRAPLADLGRAIAALRRDPVDLFLDFEQFLRAAALVARLGGARHVVGFDTPGQWRAPFYDATVPCRGDRHMALGFAELVRAAGVPTDGCATHEIAVPPAADRRLGEVLQREAGAYPRPWPGAYPRPWPGAYPRPWIVLHPGSGDNFPGRRWPTERFAEAGARLVARFGGTLLLTGSEGEKPLLAELGARLAARSARFVELGGRLDLPTLVALLARADLLLSNDTGPVHLAAAVRTPVVAFYGPNSPRLYGPLGADHRALYHPLPCSPCLTNMNGKSSRCTLPRCILGIEVDEAIAAATELLVAWPRRAAPRIAVAP
jgi:ADP-heptose:LPS heptosyltransferase